MSRNFYSAPYNSFEGEGFEEAQRGVSKYGKNLVQFRRFVTHDYITHKFADESEAIDEFNSLFSSPGPQPKPKPEPKPDSRVPTAEPTLVLEQASLVHGDGDETVTALDRVDLRVAPGEVVAVVGPSGAGKSSLLAVAGGLIKPTSGTVRLGGVDLTDLSPRRLTELRRTRIGFVFQSSNLVPALNAVDQLRLPLTFGKVEDPRDALKDVGMLHKAKYRPHQLSGGERQRLGIARALVTRPQVLLVDEPTAALDRQRSQDVVGLLAEESRAHGVATIMVTHDHDVLHHCDRVHEMIDGMLGDPVPR